jgi:hypothetical protein
MTLAELVTSRPILFNTAQIWYLGELFMYTPQIEPYLLTPVLLTHAGQIPDSDEGLHLAVDWCAAYVRDPSNPIWDNCLWCKDVDRWGQRVYLMKQNGMMEIHRYLHLTERFGVPVQ